MKYIVYILALAFVSCQGQKEKAAHQHGTRETDKQMPADTVKKSMPKEEHALIAGTHFTIRYHAPAVRGRTIWGGLVPYGEVWVTGAHSATSIETDKDITVNGTRIAAGKYAFFTIPGPEKWTMIINKKWDQHLADEYDPKEDVVRVDVAPEILPSLQERLKYAIAEAGDAQAQLTVRWEKIKVALPIQLH